MYKKILQPFYTAYVAVTFSVSILAIFPFFLVIGTGNSNKSRRVIFHMIKYWTKWWLWMIGMSVEKQGNKPPEGKYVVVANHISYLDTLVIFPAIPGYFRPLGKKEISRIPVVGFIYKQVVIMVDRSNLHSRARSLHLLWRVLHNEGNIIIFPEGTFNETEKVLKEFYDGAFRLAINTQTAVLPLVLPDTVNRWHYSGWWKFWPGKNRVIYLDPVPAAGLTLDDLPGFKKKVFDAMQAELKKYHPTKATD